MDGERKQGDVSIRRRERSEERREILRAAKVERNSSCSSRRIHRGEFVRSRGEMWRKARSIVVRRRSADRNSSLGEDSPPRSLSLLRRGSSRTKTKTRNSSPTDRRNIFSAWTSKDSRRFDRLCLRSIGTDPLNNEGKSVDRRNASERGKAKTFFGFNARSTGDTKSILKMSL